MNNAPTTWTLAEAESKLREVIKTARRLGPQAITSDGERVAVVVDAALWKRMEKRNLHGSFADFLRSSPLCGSGLEAPRFKGGIRENPV